MGYSYNSRSPCESSLKSLPCQNNRSRRSLKRKLYRSSIFVAAMMFIGFQFHASTSLEPWVDGSGYNASLFNQSTGSKTSSVVNDPAGTKGEGNSGIDVESFVDEIEYGIIKFFMSKIINAHLRRQQAALTAKLLSDEGSHEVTTKAAEEGKRIQRRPLAKTMDDSTTIRINNDPDKVLDGGENLRQNGGTKTIVLYTRFFGRRSWASIFGNSTDFEAHHCPVTDCVFTHDLSKTDSADAVIFHDRDFKARTIPKTRRSWQRYIWLFHEAPGMENVALSQIPDGFFNWTYTYHRDSDLLLLYGGVQPIQGGDSSGSRPGLLNRAGETYQEYLTILNRLNTTQEIQSLPEEENDSVKESSNSSSPRAYDGKKLVAWMVSHCTTWSGRELYVKEMMQHIDVDVYGSCGPFSCGKTHHDSYCYSNVLAANYKFYLSFENSLCNDYITEKVWYPLHYGLVPVVYGGARYEDYLPPHSYIDATNMTPTQLVALLRRLAANQELYDSYHLWRTYWRVVVPPPMCELCQRLHEDVKPSTVKNPQKWWKEVNNCTTRYPFEEYPRQDLRLLVSKVESGLQLFRKMVSHFV